MRVYQLKYYKNNVMLIAMIGIPALFISFLFYFLYSLPVSLPESYTLILVSLSIITMALTILLITRTQIFVESKVSINKEGIGFKLKNTSILYRRADFFSKWENVARVTEMFDNQNGGYFYQIAFKNPCFTANFSPLKNHESDADLFFLELQQYQENYHISNKLQPSNSF